MPRPIAFTLAAPPLRLPRPFPAFMAFVAFIVGAFAFMGGIAFMGAFLAFMAYTAEPN